MAIEFDGASGIISFASNSAVDNLDQKTIVVMFNPGGVGEGGVGRIIDKSDSGTDGWLLLFRDASGRIEYQHYFAGDGGTPALWHTPTNGFPDNIIAHFAMAYDRTSTDNDPIFYDNGVSVTVTEGIAPTGALDDDNAVNLLIGNRTADDRTYDGIFYKILIYNRILPANEIADDFNSKRFISSLNGLVWACSFFGASGLQVYDGTSLSASNKLIDYISGSQGTPTNSPIGRDDTYFSYSG